MHIREQVQTDRSEPYAAKGGLVGIINVLGVQVKLGLDDILSLYITGFSL